MSIGSLGAIGSFATAPATQRTSDADKVQHETADQSRAESAAEYAEQAAGIGETREESKTSDRDADGRRIWEHHDQKSPEEPPVSTDAPLSKDPTGSTGSMLDLTG